MDSNEYLTWGEIPYGQFYWDDDGDGCLIPYYKDPNKGNDITYKKVGKYWFVWSTHISLYD